MRSFVARIAVVTLLVAVPLAALAGDANREELHTLVSLPRISHTPVRQLLEKIAHEADLRLALDFNSMEAATSALDTRIDANFPSIPAGRALTLVLSSVGLSYEITGETILIKCAGDEEKFKEVVYNVADITAPVHKGETAAANCEKIADLIRSNIAVPTWAENGVGPRELKTSNDGRSLTATRTPAVHHEIIGLLEQLRTLSGAGVPKEALEVKVTLNCRDELLTEVLGEISYQTGANIFLEPGCKNQRVDINVKNVVAREALSKLIEPLQLHRKFVDEAVVITADKRFFSMTYSIGDLVVGGPNGPDLQSIVQKIRSDVAPDSWKRSDTEASIDGFTTNMSLVVCQNEAGHEQLQAYLKKLRSKN